MSNPLCQATIPVSCRVHGLGKKLPETAYKEILAKVNEELDKTAAFKKIVAKDDTDFFNKMQNGYAEMVWKNSIKTYNYKAKLDKAKNHTLPQKSVTNVADEIYNKAATIFNENKDLEFYTHKSELLPFKAVIIPLKAKDNCAQTSALIVKTFDQKDFSSDTPLKLIRVDAPDSKNDKMFWHHAAVEVEKDGQKYVVDYTINQFDKTQPIPYVGTVEDWKQKLVQITGEQWTSEHLGSWFTKGGETKEDLTPKKFVPRRRT